MHKGLILEILFVDNILKIGFSERGSIMPSLKSMTSWEVDFNYIEKLCYEMNSLLDKQSRINHIEKENINELKKLGRLLFEHLLSKKIKERLKIENDTYLTLNVDERLIFIPWELLHTGDDFLCLKFNVGRSITVEKELESSGLSQFNLPLRMLIIANPTSDLESAYKEGVKIKNFLLKFKDIQVDFKSLSVDSMYLRKNLGDYDFFHFAGHCEFDQNEPLNSGLVLKDGRFTCKDILMFMSRSHLPCMAFVNACQSSYLDQKYYKRYTAQQIYNLAHTFLFGGCQHFIGSSFMVNDELGAEFAQNFYAEILKGESIGYALRQSRINIIKKYGSDTLVWADYILYGDPEYVLLPRSIYKKNYVGLNMLLRKKKNLFLSTCALGVILLLFFILSYFNPISYRLYQQGLVYFKEGKNDMVFKTAQKIVKKYPQYPFVYRLLADTHFRLGNLDEALRDYFEYLRMSQKRKDSKNTSSAYIKIAWTYHMRGDYLKAEEFYRKALDLSRKNKDKLNEADALSRTAVYYADKRNFEKALSLLIQSAEINMYRKQDRDFRFNLACDYFNMAWVFSQMQDLEKAKEFYNKSKEIFSGLGKVEELSDYYFNMGEIARFERQYQKALDFYQKGLEIDKKLSHYFNLSSDYQMLAELYWEMEKFAEAEVYFLEALKLSQRIKNLPVLAQTYYNLGLFYKERNDYSKADEYLVKAESLYRELDLPDADKIKEEILSLKNQKIR